MEIAGGVAPVEQPVAGIPGAFQNDPINYLSSVASKPPSYQALDQLAGSVARWFYEKPPDRESSSAPVAAAYLQAAAIHLKKAAPPGEAQRVEAARTKAQNEIFGAVGICASLCKHRRGAISSSGILPVLGDILLHGQGHQQDHQLSSVGVEFLQCALLAEQYRYAARLVEGTWPRPDSTVDVKQVLRYYYLRGMIHLGCNDYVMAHRCFWTCLSVPAEVVCRTAIEAWKKLVLVQCLLNEGVRCDGNTVSLPKSVPTCIERLLASSVDASSISAYLSEPLTLSVFELTERAIDGKKAHVDTECSSCYMNISSAFCARDKARLQSLIATNEETLKGDGNVGLAQQCLTQLVHNQVRHISKMYSVVPLAKMATILGIPSGDAVQQQVATLLIQSGVPCEMQESGMIEFGESTDEATGTDSLVQLANWICFLETVQRLDVEFLTSPRYQSLVTMDASSIIGGAGEKKSLASGSGPRGVDDL